MTEFSKIIHFILDGPGEQEQMFEIQTDGVLTNIAFSCNTAVAANVRIMLDELQIFPEGRYARHGDTNEYHLSIPITVFADFKIWRHVRKGQKLTAINTPATSVLYIYVTKFPVSALTTMLHRSSIDAIAKAVG